MFTLRRKKETGNTIETPKCNEHFALVKQVARLEGELVAILILLSVVIAKLFA